MDVFLIIVMVVVPLLCLVGNFYFILNFVDPLEKYSAWFPKIVTMIALLVAECMILMLPLDIVNRGPPNKGIDMDSLWLAMYIIVVLLIVIIIPFVMSFYESSDSEGKKKMSKRIFHSVLWAILFALVFAGVVTGLYIPLGIAEIPTQRISSAMLQEGTALPTTGCIEPCGTEASSFSLRVSPILFMITLVCVIGYVILVLFGGIGLAALPFDLCRDWYYRPQEMSLKEYNDHKRSIGETAARLFDEGEDIMERRKALEKKRLNKEAMKLRTEYNNWRKEVELVEGDYVALEAAYGKQQGYHILWTWLKLPLGVICAIVSIVWIAHIFCYLIVPGKNILFLNAMFTSLHEAWDLLGTIFYGIFAFYLLLCVVKGLLKFGMRFLFCCPIYPLKVHGTFMTSFLMNTMIILLGALTTVNFCMDAFTHFARSTSAMSIFALSVNEIKIFKYIFKYAVFGFPIFALLALILMCIKPHDGEKPTQFKRKSDKKKKKSKKVAKDEGSVELKER